MKKHSIFALLVFVVCVLSWGADSKSFFTGHASRNNSPVFSVKENPKRLAPLATEFTPLVPVDPQRYQLGPGDTLGVHIIVGDNALNMNYTFVMSPEGSFFFPQLGEVSFAGLTLAQAKQKLRQRIQTKYKNFTLSVLLQQPRKIKVYVVGQVKTPGLYTVWATSRLSEVLAQAQGILPGGSQRDIFVKRGETLATVDLYDIYKDGIVDLDRPLQTGDIIEVPLAKNIITIQGEVNRPGHYEIREGERIKDVLAMPGALAPNSSLSKAIYLKRHKGADEFENIKLNLHDLLSETNDHRNIRLQAGDIITIPAIEAYVYVQGDVGQPGRLAYIPGKQLSDYLNLAGGPLAKANLTEVTVARQVSGKTKLLKINAHDILRYGQTEKDIEIMGGDVINVPGNFFYVNDFTSLSNIVLTVVALYNVLTGR